MKYYLVPLLGSLLLIGPAACRTSGYQEKPAAPSLPADSLGTQGAAGTLPVPDAVVQAHLDQLKEEWKTAPNPVIATFRSSEFGDYFHLVFEDGRGKAYDFGDGDNNLGEVALYDDDFAANPEYLGRKFRIFWAWKKSSFYCCEGATTPVEAEVPSITAIEPVGTGRKKRR